MQLSAAIPVPKTFKMPSQKQLEKSKYFLLSLQQCKSSKARLAFIKESTLAHLKFLASSIKSVVLGEINVDENDRRRLTRDKDYLRTFCHGPNTKLTKCNKESLIATICPLLHTIPVIIKAILVQCYPPISESKVTPEPAKFAEGKSAKEGNELGSEKPSVDDDDDNEEVDGAKEVLKHDMVLATDDGLDEAKSDEAATERVENLKKHLQQRSIGGGGGRKRKSDIFGSASDSIEKTVDGASSSKVKRSSNYSFDKATSRQNVRCPTCYPLAEAEDLC